jgi:hypothetical protein
MSDTSTAAAVLSAELTMLELAEAVKELTAEIRKLREAIEAKEGVGPRG